MSSPAIHRSVSGHVHPLRIAVAALGVATLVLLEFGSRWSWLLLSLAGVTLVASSVRTGGRPHRCRTASAALGLVLVFISIMPWVNVATSWSRSLGH